MYVTETCKMHMQYGDLLLFVLKRMVKGHERRTTTAIIHRSTHVNLEIYIAFVWCFIFGDIDELEP